MKKQDEIEATKKLLLSDYHSLKQAVNNYAQT